MADNIQNDILLNKERAAQLNEINLLGAEYKNLMRDASINMKEQLSTLGASQGEIDDMVNGFAKFNKLADHAKNLSKQDLSSRKKRNALQSAANEAASKMVQIEAKVTKYKDRAATLTAKANNAEGKKRQELLKQVKANEGLVNSAERQLEYAGQLSREMKTMLDISKRITNAGKGFAFFSDLVSDVPVLGAVFSNLTKGAEKFDDSMAAGESRIVATLRGLGEFIKLGAKALAVFAVQSAIKGMTLLDQATVSLNRNLVMAGKSASIAFGNVQSAAARTGMTLAKLLPLNESLNSSLGTSAVFSKETLTAQSLLVNKLGLGADEAAKLYKETAGTNETVGKFVRNTANLVTDFNKTNKTAISIKTVMQDVSQASARVSINAKQFPGGIKQAALEARRLGTTLEKTASGMEAMLDFETSISNEMEAEILLGRQLNLDKMRAAALANDQGTYMKELAKNAGTAAEYGKLNSVQASALAAALGTSKDELAEMFKSQEGLAAASAESVAEGGKQAKSGEELINSLQGQVTLGEGFASAMERVQLAFGGIIMGMAPQIKEFMTFVAGKAEEFINFIKTPEGQEAVAKIKEDMVSIGNVLKETVLPFLKDVYHWLKEDNVITSNWKASLYAIAGIRVFGFINILKTGYKLISKLGNAFGIKGKIASAFRSGGMFSSTGSIANAFKPGGALMKGLSSFGSKISESGIGQFLSKAGKGAMEFASTKLGSAGQAISKVGQSMNPMNAIRKALESAGGISKVAGKFAKVPILGAAIEGAFAYNDIQNLMSSGMEGKELDAAIGSRAYGAIGGVLGSIGGSLLGSIFPGAGTLIGGVLGAFGGPYLARGIASMFDEDYSKFGAVVSDMPFFKQSAKSQNQEIPVKDFVLKPLNEDTITMAGGTKLGGNVEALLQELISLTREGKTITMDGYKVGRSIDLATSKLSY
jgi:hypothetical protein|tara:strand:- start:30 stop:2837 length:2808 start_codon:yes stop_codon:yes gene_type:complete